MTEEEKELEKRAVEELLRETDRARLRAETMGPAGWLKCPLRGTNKRFLLNTLRSTSLQRRPGGEPKEGHSSPSRRSPSGKSRSRSPPSRRDGGHSRKHHRRQDIYSGDAKRRDRERERSHRRKGERERHVTSDGHSAEKDRRASKTRTGH